MGMKIKGKHVSRLKEKEGGSHLYHAGMKEYW